MTSDQKLPPADAATPPNAPVAGHQDAEHTASDGATNGITQASDQVVSEEKGTAAGSGQPSAAPELDEFGLPIRPRPQRRASESSEDFKSADEGEDESPIQGSKDAPASEPASDTQYGSKPGTRPLNGAGTEASSAGNGESSNQQTSDTQAKLVKQSAISINESTAGANIVNNKPVDNEPPVGSVADSAPPGEVRQRATSKGSYRSPVATRAARSNSTTERAKEIGGISEWSHQVLAPPKEDVEVEEDVRWQDMPTDSQMDWYDDTGHLVAKGAKAHNDEIDLSRGGAGRGYTRVLLDEDAQSATSMEDHTAYLFKNKGGGTNVVDDEGDEEGRDPLAQMQATKDLLTEGQRIAYVGVVKLSMEEMRKEMDRIEVTKKFKKEYTNAMESMQMWSQKMMVRLFSHMDISSSEQVMIEQLAEHGIEPSDMTQALMQNARVKNPIARQAEAAKSTDAIKSPRASSQIDGHESDSEEPAAPPPPYSEQEKDHVPEIVDASTLEKQDKVDIDLRWTVLCDLFLVLIADSVYDARSRVLLETVGKALQIPWIDICRFEKRVTDALEMQEQAAREDWDEADHVENRRKMALKKKYLMMGLATAGGGLVIGLSAGLLAPVIGAGLAAGFSAIGVAGTSGFLAGAGGAAIITTSSAIAGGTIAVKASHRRMGAVKTFEYRPLHNNKRVNLILTISGWMTGKVDDVRLPFSTVDPIMGDIYSLFWEPEMLQSMGDTIRIIANEALTQGIQQVLASTFLTALMAGLSAPIILSKLAYLIDNPWSSSLDRAERAGLILADSIIDRHLGVRPITLVGFSLGARVIFSCLKELSNRAAYGLIQNVYIFGSPVVANKEEWMRARTVISGRFVNGYASNDWILGYLFRATSGGIQRVAGLAGVEDVPGLENVACTHLVPGHMSYRAAMPRLLREVGWEVESDEFTEIEDPDPDNHEGRQRELLQEIEDARSAAKEEPKQRWWSNKKKTSKKSWELFDGKSALDPKAAKGADSGKEETLGSVLFDVEAIKKEFASEHMEVKQLESTLPPIQVDLKAQEAREEEERKENERLKAGSGGGWFRSKSYNAVNSATSLKSTSPNPEKAGKEKEPSKEKDGNKKSPPRVYDYDEDEDMDPYAHGAGEVSMSFEMPDSTTQGAGHSEHERPPLKSVDTTPVMRNAWAEDVEDQGEEGEITMQFA